MRKRPGNKLNGADLKSQGVQVDEQTFVHIHKIQAHTGEENRLLKCKQVP